MSSSSDLTVSSISIYPIKSCGRLDLDQAEVVGTGFDHDREWMVVNDQGWFVTQLQYPHMATIQPVIKNSNLVLNAPDMQTLKVPVRSDRPAHAIIWANNIEVYDQGDEAAEWFSTILGRSCRLVRKTPAARPINKKYQITGKEIVGFANGYPFLLLSQASLDDLNTRLGQPRPMTRFRPSITIAGGTPYQEDAWRRIKIGPVILRITNPCARCEVVNVDQDTGEKDIQPLDALGEYRRRAKGIMFGQNLVHENMGTIRVGDAVTILE